MENLKLVQEAIKSASIIDNKRDHIIDKNNIGKLAKYIVTNIDKANNQKTTIKLYANYKDKKMHMDVSDFRDFQCKEYLLKLENDLYSISQYSDDKILIGKALSVSYQYDIRKFTSLINLDLEIDGIFTFLNNININEFSLNFGSRSWYFIDLTIKTDSHEYNLYIEDDFNGDGKYRVKFYVYKFDRDEDYEDDGDTFYYREEMFDKLYFIEKDKIMKYITKFFDQVNKVYKKYSSKYNRKIKRTRIPKSKVITINNIYSKFLNYYENSNLYPMTINQFVDEFNSLTNREKRVFNACTKDMYFYTHISADNTIYITGCYLLPFKQIC